MLRAAFQPYPAIEPYESFQMVVDPPHELYVEQSGNPEGIPAVYLHGGPGGGCQPSQRRLFDPERYRAVLFDQRGAGRSRPRRSLEANTTQDLVADLERIRERLGIARWLVVGGSWGSTLALAYAEAHPDRVTGLILRAVLLGTAEEIDWAFGQGPRAFRPDLWRAFTDLLPEPERAEPIAAYGARLEHADPAVHGPAAKAWLAFEQGLSVLQPGAVTLPAALNAKPASSERLPDSPFVEWHYIKNGFFLRPGQILEEAGRLAGIPGVIIQGRYDLLCPPASAQALADRWPDAEFKIVEGAGHSLSETEVAKAVLKAVEEFKRRLG